MEINELFNLKESNSPVNTLPDDENVFKHILMRLGVFLATAALLTIVALIIDEDYAIIGALIIGVGLFFILLLFLLIESFILYSNKKKILGITNLIILSFLVVIGGLIFLSMM